MKRFSLLKKVFIRELRLVSKDVNIIAIVLLAPLFYAFFYGAMYMKKVETNVEITIIDNDNTATTNKLIRYLDSHQMLTVNIVRSSLGDTESDLITDQAKAIVYFPRNFEKELKKGKQTDLKVYLNSTKFLVSNDLNKAINEVLGTVGGGIKLKYFETKGYNYDQAIEIIQPLKVDIRPLFSFTESYGDFLIPAVLILILQQTLLIGLAESFAKEREEGLLYSLYKTAGEKVSIMINGKSFFYFLLFGSYITFFYLVNFHFFKLQNIGDFLPIFISTLLLLVAVICLAVLFSTFFKRKIIAVQFLTLSSYPIFLISGYSWPFDSLPLWLKGLSSLFPTTPYYAAFTRISQMGAGLNDVLPELIHLVVLALTAYALAYFRLNGLLKKTRNSQGSELFEIKTA